MSESAFFRVFFMRISEHLALRLLFAQAEIPFNTGLLGDVPS